MSEWVERPLGELANLEIGGTPSRDNPDYWADANGDGHPWVSISDLRAGRVAETSERITDLGVRHSNVKPIKRGTVLMTFKLTIGEVAVADCDLFTNEAIVALAPKSKEISSEFLFHILPGAAKSAVTDAAIKGATLNKDKLAKLVIRYPENVDQQATIARILRALNSQIEATEGLIAKQERVRAGLMQDLFTRGVDAHGQLRTARDQAPHFYHQIELGWLPLGWEAPELESMLAAVPTPMRSGPFGSALLKHELVDSGVPFLGIDNIHVEQFKSDFSRFVTPRKFSELSRYRVMPDDVVITIMGTVGRCCVIPNGFGEMLSSKHLWTMSFDQSKVLPKLVCWQLNFAPWVQSWFRAKSQGGIMDAIQSSTLKQLRLPTPPMPEQIQILAIYEVATSHLGQMRRELAKLRLQKSGLMQDLLTGTVPVAPLLEAVPA
jgi:type I restriction enzyme, S subunit